jgi:hypothetical protein
LDIDAAEWKGLKLFTLVLHLITFQMRNQVTKLCNLIWYIESLRIMGWQPIRVLNFIHRNKQNYFPPQQTTEFYSAQSHTVTATPVTVQPNRTENVVLVFLIVHHFKVPLCRNVYSATDTDATTLRS